MAPSNRDRDRWQETKRLARETVGIAVAVVAVPVLVGLWLAPSSDGWAFGTMIAATLAPPVVAAVTFWFCQRQEAVDRAYGLFED